MIIAANAAPGSSIDGNGVRQSRPSSLVLAARQTLEMIAAGASLVETLASLCGAIDAQSPEIISTVLLADRDGERLRPVAGPRVPAGWTEAITPLTIGPDIGSCGTAAFLKERVIIPDIASDTRWSGAPAAQSRDVAMSYGLRAAWSEPLVSKDDELLGTFAIYYAEPRSPGSRDLQLIEDAAQVAVIAIEADRSRTALEKAANEARGIVDAIPQAIAVLSADGMPVYGNRVLLEYTGLTIDEMMSLCGRARRGPCLLGRRVVAQGQIAGYSGTRGGEGSDREGTARVSRADRRPQRRGCQARHPPSDPRLENPRAPHRQIHLQATRLTSPARQFLGIGASQKLQVVAVSPLVTGPRLATRARRVRLHVLVHAVLAKIGRWCR